MSNYKPEQAVINVLNDLMTNGGLNRNGAISAYITHCVKNEGVKFPVAYESVFGPGSYKWLAGLIYDKLKAKAA